jgi:hypothetical protein
MMKQLNVRVDVQLFEALRARYARKLTEQSPGSSFYSWNAFLRDCLATMVLADAPALEPRSRWRRALVPPLMRDVGYERRLLKGAEIDGAPEPHR